jgi:hypothetical protein
MTWGRYRTGTRLWHWIEPAAPRKTRCGRSFPQAPESIERGRPKGSDGDICQRCAAMIQYARALAADLDAEVQA